MDLMGQSNEIFDLPYLHQSWATNKLFKQNETIPPKLLVIMLIMRTLYYTAQCTLCNVQCTLCTVQCTLCTVQRTLFTVQCTLCTVHCTVYTHKESPAFFASFALVI